MVSADDVRRLALSLPRSYEVLVRDRVKFRVGRIVFLSLSPDETLMGFGYPREERAALVAAEPDKFLMPVRSDERYNWMRVRLAAIDLAEMRELVVDSWRMVVPKRVAAAYDAQATQPSHPAEPPSAGAPR
ncbi:MAG: MmcQ/YjbR family DNA-binding protein [Micromonosporaceae bacterium]